MTGTGPYGMTAGGSTLATDNPLLDAYFEQMRHQRVHRRYLIDDRPDWRCLECLIAEGKGDGRRKQGLRFEYGFAVPDGPALACIARHSPHGVTEVGAGKGYWAWLLQERGVDVDATDIDPTGGEGDKGWFVGEPFTTVRQCDAVTAAREADPRRTLLTIWPDYAQGWSAEALRAYRGDTVIYVGEGAGGCTGDDAFHALLGDFYECWPCSDGRPEECSGDCARMPEPEWRNVETVAIPQWGGLHDRLEVYKRLTGSPHYGRE